MKSKNDIKLLDCTFRDGGYYNGWDFSPALIEVTPKTAPEVAPRLSGAGYAVHRIDERSGDVTRCNDGKVPGVVNLSA